MSKIEILLHSQLIKDVLSATLIAAGFLVVRGQDQHSDDTIVIIDFNDFIDREVVRLLQLRSVKIVVLASEPDSRKISADDITPLCGVVTYSLSTDALVQSLRLIGDGERVFPRNLVLGQNPSVPSSGAKPQSRSVRLSPREREVLIHLVEGHTNKVIAWRLGMTEATAKVHLKSVMRKINVDNRTQAALWARSNLPELDPTPRGFV